MHPILKASLTAPLLLAMADTARAGDNDASASPKAPVIEFATFRLIEGADREAFLEAARATQSYLCLLYTSPSPRDS